MGRILYCSCYFLKKPLLFCPLKYSSISTNDLPSIRGILQYTNINPIALTAAKKKKTPWRRRLSSISRYVLEATKMKTQHIAAEKPLAMPRVLRDRNSTSGCEKYSRWNLLNLEVNISQTYEYVTVEYRAVKHVHNLPIALYNTLFQTFIASQLVKRLSVSEVLQHT